MFTLSKNTELTKELLQKIINRFMTTERPKLQLWDNYYRGKHAILSKSYSDASKECNHIITNYCKIITDTYGGYICGKPVSYSSNEDITDIQDTLNYNDSAAQDMSMITNALIYGVAYELQWIDKYSQVRYSQINPLNCFAIFDNTLDCELLYFVRWYKLNAIDDNDKTFAVEVYDKNTIRHYTTPELGGALTEVDTEPHYFGDVPVTVFYLNENEENIFNSVITLNDAYNELQSSEIDDFNAWVDAYLTFTGVDAETDDINAMKENRVLVLPEGAEASWLTKNANDTQIVNILENIKKNIFKVTACPDMADETFLAQSGTALAYKLVGFENVASGIVARFTKALQHRIELICNVLNLKASDATWRDIRINFVRNLPVNLTETINLVNNLKGTVSDATLLAQLPFIKDVGAELEAVKKQKQDELSVYGFGAPTAAEDE